MRLIHFSFIPVLVLLIITVVPAQQLVPLSIEKAISTGLANSKSLHSSLMKVQYADAKSSEVNAIKLPTITAAGSYTRLSDVPPFSAILPANIFGPGFPPTLKTIPLSTTILDNYNLRLIIHQPLFTGFRVRSSVNIADYQSKAANEDYKKDKADLVYNIKQAYWNLYKAIEFKKVIDENVHQVKAHLRDVQNFLEQGIVTKNELLKVEVQLSNVEILQIDAKNNVALAMLGLNSLIGLPLDTKIEITSNIQPKLNQYKDLNLMVQEALKLRFEVKGMEFRVKAGESGVDLAKSSWFPQIYLSGNYNYARPNQRIIPALNKFKDTWDVGVTASLDIWNWGRTIFQTDQAQAQLAQAKDGLDQMKDGITLEVAQAYYYFNQSQEKIIVAEKGVAQAEENFRITNDKFKSGMVSSTDLLDAEAALLQAKFNYIHSQIDSEIADARLKRAIGSE